MTLVMNQLLDSKLIEANDEEENDNKSTEKQEDDAMVLWDCVSMFDTEKESDLRHEDILEANVTMRSQGIIKEDSLIIPKIKRLQKNVKKFQKNTTTNKIPEFTITSQNPKQINVPTNPIEEKINNVKTNLTEHKMEYDIVEDIKKVKANISLFEMCNVLQQKEKLLKALEMPEEKLPTNNQPQEEEIGEASVGGKPKCKTPPFLLTFEIFNHNVHNYLVDSRASVNVMPLSVCKKINGHPKLST